MIATCSGVGADTVAFLTFGRSMPRQGDTTSRSVFTASASAAFSTP
jgi:hypothetical protein